MKSALLLSTLLFSQAVLARNYSCQNSAKFEALELAGDCFGITHREARQTLRKIKQQMLSKKKVRMTYSSGGDSQVQVTLLNRSCKILSVTCKRRE